MNYLGIMEVDLIIFPSRDGMNEWMDVIKLMMIA